VEIDVIDNDFSLTDDQWRNFIFPLDYVRRFKSNLLQKVSGHEAYAFCSYICEYHSKNSDSLDMNARQCTKSSVSVDIMKYIN
jgi:hypothetical protein